MNTNTEVRRGLNKYWAQFTPEQRKAKRAAAMAKSRARKAPADAPPIPANGAMSGYEISADKVSYTLGFLDGCIHILNLRR